MSGVKKISGAEFPLSESCPWGKLSVEHIVHEASCLGVKLSAEQNVRGAKCPWDKFSNGANCSLVEMSWARWPWSKLQWGELSGFK